MADQAGNTAHSLRDPPPPGALLPFAPGTPLQVLLTVDTEEEFDWTAPFRREGWGLSHVAELPRFQAFCEGLGAHPAYLVDWPIATDPRSVEIIGEAVARGRADVGMQLHPWVNPPFEEEVSTYNSFAGNLPQALEEAKFMALRDRVEEAFGARPLIYRAGRYCLGQDTHHLLRRAGIRIDTSVRALFDYSAQGGPDYSRHPLVPYRVGADEGLIELPVTTLHTGRLRRWGPAVQRLERRLPRALGALARLGLLERIALTPEGVTAAEAIRGIDTALEDGLPVLVLSFHSPTLSPGLTPYAGTQGKVEELYRWFEAVYRHLDRRGVRSVSVAGLLAGR